MSERRPWTWPSLIAVTVAKGLLATLAGLAIWAALPAVIGWHPTTVSSGSMMPRLHVGDVAVSRPIGAQVPPLGSVLLFDDPDHPGRLRMHRFLRLDDDGLLVTRGDANPSEDSTPVPLSSVRGIGTLRVPWLALPIVWLREGRWLFVGLAAAGLALLVVVAAGGRDRDLDEDLPAPPGDVETDGSDGSDGSHGSEGADGADGVGRGEGGAAVLRSVAARALGSLVVAGVLVLPSAVPAEARFTATTASRGQLAATTYFRCAGAVAAFSPYLWYRMDETSSTTTTAADSSGSTRTGLYGSSGKTPTTSRACTHDTGGAMTFNGSTGYLSSGAVTGGMPSVFTVSIWFRSTTRTGGKLIGFGSAQTGASGNYDRHIYMTNGGQIFFGVYASAVRTVSSPKAYNDGAWHLATASLSSAGMRLYLDGGLVDSDTTVTTAEPGTTAYLRVGFDNLDNWTSTPTSRYFAGTLDDAAYFPSALTASQVAALYEAGTS